MSGIFGWDLPPGVTNAMIERAQGGDDPDMPNCAECGADASTMEWADDGECACYVAVCHAYVSMDEHCGARVTVEQCDSCARADADDRWIAARRED